MKKLKTLFILNSSIYWSIYLIKTFIIWDFKNPFQWIIDLPIYSDGDRFLILFFILFGIAVEVFIAKTSIDNNGQFY